MEIYKREVLVKDEVVDWPTMYKLPKGGFTLLDVADNKTIPALYRIWIICYLMDVDNAQQFLLRKLKEAYPFFEKYHQGETRLGKVLEELEEVVGMLRSIPPPESFALDLANKLSVVFDKYIPELAYWHDDPMVGIIAATFLLVCSTQVIGSEKIEDRKAFVSFIFRGLLELVKMEAEMFMHSTEKLGEIVEKTSQSIIGMEEIRINTFLSSTSYTLLRCSSPGVFEAQQTYLDKAVVDLKEWLKECDAD